MKTSLKTKKNPFRDCEIVTATTTFLGETVTIRAGEKRRGNDPVVEQHWGAFAEGDLLPAELAKIAAEAIPLDPPVHEPHVYIPPSIPPHRLVVALADTFTPMPFAPGSAGAKAKGAIPPAPFGTGIKKGRAYDVGDAIVRARPNLFEFPRRDVTLADVERLTADDAIEEVKNG